MAKQTLSIEELANVIETIKRLNLTVNDVATLLDEKFYKQGTIETRGDFRVMCELERY